MELAVVRTYPAVPEEASDDVGGSARLTAVPAEAEGTAAYSRGTFGCKR
jgi:hypothetical protein